MICLQKRTNCIFNAYGRCEILNNTEFSRPCPFFKKGATEIVRDHELPGKNGIFRDIKGFNGRYYVSEYGEIVSKYGNTIHFKYTRSGKPIVQLQRESGNFTTVNVDIVVADAFIGGSGTVIHKDGNVLNNERWNLERKD